MSPRIPATACTICTYDNKYTTKERFCILPSKSVPMTFMSPIKSAHCPCKGRLGKHQGPRYPSDPMTGWEW